MRARIGMTFQSLTRPQLPALRHRPDRSSCIGVWMQFIAQDWLVLELSDNSATALGVVTALAVHADPAADPLRRQARRPVRQAPPAHRRERRLHRARARRMGVLVVTGTVTLALVFVFAALHRRRSTPSRPRCGRRSSPSWSAAELLPNALSLVAQPTFNTARIVGPGGRRRSPIGCLGLGPVFLINGVTYLAPARRALRDAPRRAVPRPRKHADPTREIRDGLRYVWQPRRTCCCRSCCCSSSAWSASTSSSPSPVLAKTVFAHRRRSSSACSPPPSRSARWPVRWPAAAAGPGRACTLVLGAAIAFGCSRDAGRVRAHVLADRCCCSCRPASS